MNDVMVKDNLPVKMHYLVNLSKLQLTSKQNLKNPGFKGAWTLAPKTVLRCCHQPSHT